MGKLLVDVFGNVPYPHLNGVFIIVLHVGQYTPAGRGCQGKNGPSGKKLWKIAQGVNL